MRTQFIYFVLAVILFCPFAHSQWVQSNGPFGMSTGAIAVRGRTVLAAGVSLYRSTNLGDHWNKIDTGTDEFHAIAIARNDSLFAAGRYDGGIALSSDDGLSWKSIAGLPLTGYNVRVAFFRNSLLALANKAEKSILITSDRGLTWHSADIGLPSGYRTGIAVTDARAYVIVEDSSSGKIDGGVFATSDPSLGWVSMSQGLPTRKSRSFTSIAARGSDVFVGMTGVDPNSKDRVFASNDSGASWHSINDSLFESSGYPRLFFGDSSLYMVPGGGTLYRTTDLGSSWAPLSLPVSQIGVMDLAIESGSLFAGTAGGVYRSTDDGSTWRVSNEGILECFAAAFFPVPPGLLVGTEGSGCFLSTDFGNFWSPRNEGLDNLYVSSIAGADSVILAGTGGSGVFRSVDYGLSWTGGAPAENQVNALTVIGKNVFAGTEYYGVWRSTNMGSVWQSTAELSGQVKTLASRDSILFTGTFGSGVYFSKDAGASWTTMNRGLTDGGVYTLAALGRILIAGTTSGLFRCMPDDTTWTRFGTGPGEPGNTFIQSMMTDGRVIIVGTNTNGNNAGVFLSSDAGSSWSSIGAGLPGCEITAFCEYGPYLFAATSKQGVWRRPLTEILAAVDPEPDKAPRKFVLEQNYPNPFNPSTTIRYGLPRRSHVTLTVFTTLGQQIALLQNGEQEAGYHQVTFDGSRLSSGVYFYRIETGSFVQTRKLLLLN